MKLGDGVEQAIHSALVLSGLSADGVISAAALAEFHGVSPSYLLKHLQALSGAGIVQTVPGPKGGYRLARAADQVTVGDVLRAVEGSMNGLEPTRRGRRSLSGDPVSDLSELWREIDEAVSGVIDRVTFDDLRKRAEERRSVARPMYHI